MPNTALYPISAKQLTLATLRWLRILRQLGRAELSAMVALSGLSGYLFAGGKWQLDALLLLAGIGLLASGSSALNQWQEQDLDVRMQRTCRRPLPAGQLSPPTALLLASFSIFSGLLQLALLSDVLALLLGVLAVIWYNGIYTPLKRRTAFAALPGAVCGALPPLIGWVAAGQQIWASPVLILAGTLFIWQIPHTWLLLCCYRQDLQRSGLPDLFETLSTNQLLRINNVWLAGLGFCYLLFPLFSLIESPTLSISYIVGLFCLGLMIFSAKKSAPFTIMARKLFHLTNLSMALLLTTVILDSFF